VSQQLTLRGSSIGVGEIGGIRQRPLQLERHCRGSDIRLAENQARLLERLDPEFRERHTKADLTRDLVATDTFMAGNLTGIGKIHLQAVAGCHSRLAFGNLCASKTPTTAARSERQGPSLSPRSGAAASPRHSPTAARNIAGGWTGVPSSCSASRRKSSTAGHLQEGRKATAA